MKVVNPIQYKLKRMRGLDARSIAASESAAPNSACPNFTTHGGTRGGLCERVRRGERRTRR